MIAGANNRNINEVNQQRRTIALGAYRIHADYNPTLVLNDIATMITTPQTFTFNQFVQGIVLATGDESFAGEMATATGFGRTSDTATATSAQVRFVNQPVITNAACLAAYGIVIDAHICMSTAGGRGTCTGDGGGPLFIVRDGSFLQIGVGSFLSAAGCEAGFPSGFTRVTSFTAWIAANRS